MPETVGEREKQGEIALGTNRHVPGGGLRRFGTPGVNDYDFGRPLVAHDPLPEDRMGDTEVRSDEDDDVGLLEVCIGVRRCIESERLLVGDDRGGHALAGIAVSVEKAHPELGKRAEESHFLRGDLTGA